MAPMAVAAFVYEEYFPSDGQISGWFGGSRELCFVFL